MQKQQDEPYKRSEPSPKRGAPLTYAVHAVRKDVSVRVLVRPVVVEGEELREEGYGHGV